MRAWFAGVVAASLLPMLAASAADEPFTEELARKLLPEAGALDRPEILATVRLVNGRPDATLIRRSSSLPIVAWCWYPGRQTPLASEHDFRFEATAEPGRFATWLNGGKTLSDAKHPDGPFSVLRPENVKSVTVTSQTDGATGEVSFAAKGAFSGTLRYEARRVDGAWAVVAFEFPATKARIERAAGAPWKVVTFPPSDTSIRLPTVSAASPVPAAATSAVLYLAAREGFVENGRPLATVTDVAQLLASRLAAVPREPDGSSSADVTFVADEDAAFVGVLWAMQLAAEPEYRAFRFHFAVRHRTSGELGVLSVVTPKVADAAAPAEGSAPTAASPIPATPGPPSPPGVPTPASPDAARASAVRVAVATEGKAPATNPARVYDALVRRGVGKDKSAYVVLSLPTGGPPARYGQVVRVLDAVLRAGVEDVRFERVPMPASGDLAPLVEMAVAKKGTAAVSVGGASIGETGAPPPFPDGRAPGDTALPPPRVVPPVARPSDRGLVATSGKAAATAPPHVEWRSARAEQAVAEALHWLAAHQTDAGGWDCNEYGFWCDGVKGPTNRVPDARTPSPYDIGVSGLAVLAFLGAGVTDRFEGKFGHVVETGLSWLVAQQDGAGCVGPQDSLHAVYRHAIATHAFVVAYALTREERWRAAAQKGLDFAASARNVKYGWRYGVRPDDSDTSITTWMILALADAERAGDAARRWGRPPPFTVDAQAFKGALAWVDKMTENSSGRVGYQSTGTGSARTVENVDKFPSDVTEATTAMGLACRLVCRESPAKSDAFKKGVGLLRKLPPTWSGGSIDFIYWRYGTLALHALGGDDARKWESALDAAILDNQRHDTDFCAAKGSWNPVDAWGDVGGRVYATAILASTLETGNRFDDGIDPGLDPVREPAGPK